jgi:ketosteroid isomerase-like protein
MTAATTPARKETRIRELLDAQAQSLRARNVDALMTHYAPSEITYYLPAPLQRVGADAYRKNFEAWFGSMQGPIDYELRDLHLAASGDVAFGHYLGHVRSTRTTGEKADYWVRVTAGFRKIDGAWMIVHEHISVPVHMETMKAAFDLRP